MTVDPVSAGAVPSPPVIAGIILAAGESSRMGADKPLLMYCGKTFLENIIAALHEAGVQRVVVVLGHHAELIQQDIDLSSVEVVVNQDYRRGQTSSLQAGLRLLGNNEPDGVFLCLVDHPAMSADTVQNLNQYFKATGKLVIVPQMQGKHGHPVLLGRELFSRLLALGPDEGADTVIHQYRDQTEFVEVTDPGILIDIDDPESYLQLTSQK
jgi:molybdenum cofactor cytidylyltransferase